MVLELKCECSKRDDMQINSLSCAQQFESFFFTNIERGIFKEMIPCVPYYVFGKTKWYADKWYKCAICGCLWEYTKPDFPSSGFVRKFIDGHYRERGY